MRRLVSFVSYFSLSLGPISASLQEEYRFIPTDNDHSILAIDGEKVYLNPEKIRITEEGLFLIMDETTHFPLPFLKSDRYGIFTAAHAGASLKSTCPTCKEKSYTASCRNEDCPVVKARHEWVREQKAEKEREMEQKKEESKKRK